MFRIKDDFADFMCNEDDIIAVQVEKDQDIFDGKKMTKKSVIKLFLKDVEGYMEFTRDYDKEFKRAVGRLRKIFIDRGVK